MNSQSRRSKKRVTCLPLWLMAIAVLLIGCGKSQTNDLGVEVNVDVQPELSKTDNALKQPMPPTPPVEKKPFNPPST